jgi:hypothetical protein
MRWQIPLLIVFIGGIFMAIQYFVPLEASERIYEYCLDWIIIVGVFAMSLPGQCFQNPNQSSGLEVQYPHFGGSFCHDSFGAFLRNRGGNAFYEAILVHIHSHSSHHVCPSGFLRRLRRLSGVQGSNRGSHDTSFDRGGDHAAFDPLGTGFGLESECSRLDIDRSQYGSQKSHCYGDWIGRDCNCFESCFRN